MVNYTPSNGSAGLTTIIGTYSGDQFHAISIGTYSLTVIKIGTTAGITCNPASVVANQNVACDVSVQNSPITGKLDPTGTVDVSSGLALTTSCTLYLGKCSVTLIPAQGEAVGSQTIQASYRGDGDHLGSFGSTTVQVSLRQSSTDSKCTPGDVLVNQPTNCIVTVLDVGPGSTSLPGGKVTVTYDYIGHDCQLQNQIGSSSCSVTITPKSGMALTAYPVTAEYWGDGFHSGSSRNGANLKVEQRPVSVTITCVPNPVVHGVSTSCSVTITDSGGVSDPITPTGTVSFQASTGGGTFASLSCALAPAGNPGEAVCSVSYVQNSTGNTSIYATYSGDSDHVGNGGVTELTIN